MWSTSCWTQTAAWLEYDGGKICIIEFDETGHGSAMGPTDIAFLHWLLAHLNKNSNAGRLWEDYRESRDDLTAYRLNVTPGELKKARDL